MSEAYAKEIRTSCISKRVSKFAHYLHTQIYMFLILLIQMNSSYLSLPIM